VDGTYALIGTTTLSGSFQTIALSNPLKTASVITSGTGVSLVLSTYTGAFNWTGGASSLWDLTTHATPKNWKQNSSTVTTLTDYADGLPVGFDDAASSGAVLMKGTLTPAATVTFNNNTLAYTLGAYDSTGLLAGTAQMVKSGSGLLGSGSLITHENLKKVWTEFTEF
jgi:hypothetical protein